MANTTAAAVNMTSPMDISMHHCEPKLDTILLVAIAARCWCSLLYSGWRLMEVRTPDQCKRGVESGELQDFQSGYMTLFKHTNRKLVEAEHVHDTNMSKSTPKEIRPLQHSMWVGTYVLQYDWTKKMGKMRVYYITWLMEAAIRRPPLLPPSIHSRLELV